jgi:hypothetical protein
MKIPNKFNGYSRDGVRLYNGPAAPLALAGTTAIGTTALGGAAAAAGAGALGAGITAGATLAGGGGLFGSLGLNAIGAPGLSGLASAVTPTIAPAAASQLAGTLTGSAAQNLGLNALKSQVIGTGVQNAAAQQATNLAFQNAAAQNMAGGLANPISQMGAKYLATSPYPVANANNLNFLNSSVAGGNTMPSQALAFQPAATNPAFLNTTLEGSALPGVTSNLPAAAYGNTVMGPAIPGVTSNLPTVPAATQIAAPTSSIQTGQNFMQNLGSLMQNPSIQGVKDYAAEHPYATSAAVGLGTMGLTKMMQGNKVQTPESNAMIRPYTYERTQRPEAYAVSPTMDSSERMYFNDQYVAGEPYKAAEGGIAAAYAVGGPVEGMSAMNAIGANTGYPMASLQTPMYSNPAMQIPEATNVIAPSADAGVGAFSGEPRFAEGGEAKTEGGYSYSYDPQTMQFTQLSVPTLVPSRGVIGGAMGMGGVGYAAPAPQPVKNSGSKLSGGIATPAMGPMQSQQATPINVPAYQSPEQQLGLEGFYDMMNQRLAGYGGYGGFAAGGGVGGEPNLGGYSDGGRLLKGPGDGVSDSIPASIGGRQPARLADGEFVVPARIVSELGNGSTEAGARKLYAMMDRIQKGRRKSVGKGKVAVDSKASKHLPA